MNLASRVIGVHQLTVLGFYPLLIKYLQPSQRDVTRVIVCSAQASHALVPPDVLEPILKAIANNFVTDRVANEVMAVGINGIREICVRQPLAMDATLLQDLTQYKNHRDKSVMMAARSLIGLFREINPDLLLRKDRGKDASLRMKAGDTKTTQFGSASAMGVDGFQDLDILEAEEGGAEEEGDGWEGWEADDGSDSDSDGWIDVPEDAQYDHIDIKMSDDEDESKDKKEEDKDEEGKKTRRIGKRQLKKMQDASDREELTEEQKQKLREEAEARRAEENKKQEAMMKIASTRILTPADFARLEAMRNSKTLEAAAGKKRTAQEGGADGEVSEGTILGPRKKAKQDYEERMASIQEGREGREKFGSKKGNKDRGSTTNREKARNKNFLMVAHKRSVQGKSKRSLFDKQKQLRAAIDKQKRLKH